MKTQLALLSLLFCTLSSSAFPAVPAKPNILLIYSDDHGWADLGAQGVDKDIRTPNLDQLARDGVRFVRGYVSAPQCVPSRAGLITGRYQQRFGVEDNGKGPLPLAEVTIAERLHPAGYVSGHVGKWHLDRVGGKDDERESRVQKAFMPHAQGFDEYWRGEMRQYFASHDLHGVAFPDAPHLVKDERFRISVQTEAALSFLDRRKVDSKQPWFLYLAWFAPHVPLESAEPWFSKTPAELPLERRQALAMIAAMDEGLGQIRARLKEMGAENNTLIFFIGDNGAPLKTGAWNGSLNLPLVGEKGMLTDGGVRTPFVAAWPGTIPGGVVFERPVTSLDVAATANALAGLPPSADLDGVNLMPFLKGETTGAPHETLYWRWRTQAAALEFPWKLIQLGPDERYLFDVTKPDGETKNLIGAHPEIAQRLEAKLKTWSDSLQPAGLPSTVNRQDQFFFENYGLIQKTASAPSEPREADVGLGWVCRNGSLSIDRGALVITPSGKGVPFLTCNTLDLRGPVEATIRVRSTSSGKGSLTWRSKGQQDFLPENVATFEWAASDEFREIKTKLPIDGRLIHLRLNPGKDGAALQIQSIELSSPEGKPSTWRFDGAADSKR